MWKAFKTGLGGGAGAAIGWAAGQWFVKWMRRLLLSVGVVWSASGIFGSPFEATKPAQKPAVVQKVTPAAKPIVQKSVEKGVLK